VLPWEYALLIRAFLMIALIEEIAKISLILGQLTKNNSESFGAFAIVAASIGVGFAGAENSLHIMRHGPSVVLIRIFTATPFHICNAIVAARLLWMAREKAKPGLVLAALVSAVFLHGLYDYAIFADTVGDGKFWFALAMTGSLAINLLRGQKE
jgi:RsiW-degrading membrane proteinase PrsW (M82 family)